MSIKLAVVDDHKIFRDVLIENLNSKENKFSVIIEAEDGQSLIEKLQKNNLPDLIILDIKMPRKNGFETVEWLKSKFPEIKILVLTMFDDDSSISKMFKLGANGYLTKDISLKELITAIKSISEKGFYYSENVTHKLVHLLRNENTSTNKKSESELVLEVWQNLSIKEKEFVTLSCTDLTYSEISQKIHLSPRTVETIRVIIFNKFKVKTRVGLAVKVTTHLSSLLKNK